MQIGRHQGEFVDQVPIQDRKSRGAVRLVAVPVEATAVLKRDGLARWRRNVDGKP